MFNDSYKNKTVLITGHTGFKGTWLAMWLSKLGAKVIGVSRDIPTNPSMFESIGLAEYIQDIRLDMCDYDKLKQVVKDTKPDYIFHLAAQPIVSLSYREPLDTINSNVMGTAHILEAVRDYDKQLVLLLITSDKCYDNVNWLWGYRENDRLGGKDIYSGSKGAAELIINSYFKSFFSAHPFVRLGIARAGNVVGGGDWAKDRIVADCVRAWSTNKKVEIRSPDATRPWQHVLEPLGGYLRLGQMLNDNAELHGEAFNYGPTPRQNRTVLHLIEDLSTAWGFSKPEQAYTVSNDLFFDEARLLKLNCDKALIQLGWEPVASYKETIDYISKWYKSYYSHDIDLYELTLQQIEQYEKWIKERTNNWVGYD